MIPLTGYADRLSLRPGETIEFKVSSAGPEPFEAGLVRVACADPNPDGPGRREQPVPAAFAGSYPSRQQAVHRGSYARVAAPGGLPALGDFTLLATIWPTLPRQGVQAVLSCFDPGTGSGAALGVGENGAGYAVLGRGDAEPLHVSLEAPLAERRWVRLWVSFDSAAGRLTLGQVPLETALTGDAPEIAQAEAQAAPAAPAAFHIGALGGQPVAGHFNGKIERPQVFSRALGPEEVEAAARGEEVAGRFAHWDFSSGISSTRIEDLGPHGLTGALVNLPARGMKGSNWSGREMCWRHAPEEYGAIHFHDDDLYDCGWETDFSYTVPEDLPSGVYAARLTCGAQEDTIPFFVCPPKGTRRAELCVIVPTFTYVIYANHRRLDFGPHWRERARVWTEAYPHNPADHTEYGLSTYDFHGDGSGICHATPFRPILTLRSGYISIAEERGSGLRHFQADTHLLDWLDNRGFAYDLLTDQEVHEEGVEALAGYRCVLTASHPEYHTKETLDALEAYRDGGGRFCYLGGNGFYWRVALHRELPGVLEIRRGEGGIRAWAAEPGEYYNAFDGAYGGLWRRNGRPPQRIGGVGFSAQGIFEGSYYRRRPESRDPRAAWIFDGVEDEILGDFGVSGGGAAGYELDRVDRRLGSPDHALVVASSEGHGPSFVLVPEEHLTHVATWPGESQEALIRADMTFFETPAGGAVFSTGSITFCGSLSHDNYDNNISRILKNVLDRFLDPEARFAMPDREPAP